ncbi:hypothetical protein Celaphus_00015250 [Cervus elaphus hippelaphus]|uniref:non-specific serine/threonine protein kinase n=1 Tax=Cervus elaphus hippelaphus TaxID=46360 RepID=A0A212CSI6_CEREH|nr:hypothetical protein Celaphus_00015250 [Cervus elaphus hippelaphus]
MAISANKDACTEIYKILHTIRDDRFAKVKLAQHVVTGLQELLPEVNSMKVLNHPNTVKLPKVTDTEEKLSSLRNTWGGMHTFLDEQGCMTKAGARGRFRQLLLALQHCHQQGTVCLDLTLSSMLLDENQKVKILDFSLSNEYNPREKLLSAALLPTHPLSSSWGGATRAHLWTCKALTSSYSHVNWVLPLPGTRFLAALA